MDNLTHSLVGAMLGRMGLKRLTGRAMPVLIVSANLPDIDSFVAPLIGEAPLSFHRGFTHGVGGWIVMPFIATALVLAWNRWRPANEPVRPWPLLLLAVIGTLSHPLLDLMNTYGVRLLEPFSDRWFYADTLFIMDAWIWIMLILGLEFSWARERVGRNWQAPAIAAFAAVLAYTAANFAISHRAEALTRDLLVRDGRQPEMVVASPLPLQFWKRRLIWRGGGVGGSGRYDWFANRDHVAMDGAIVPLNMDDPRLAAAAARDRDVRTFLFWSRMPVVIEEDGRAYLSDQRFLDRSRRPRTHGNFVVPLDSAASRP